MTTQPSSNPEITVLLRAIRDELVKLNQASAPLSPAYRRRLSEFRAFDWDSIGARVVASDAQGVAEVEWNAHRFDRRTGEKFGGRFIIFSRPAGDEAYHTLIKFADYNQAPLEQVAPTLNPAEIYTPPAPVAPTTPPPAPARRGRAAAADPKKEFYALGGSAIGEGKLDPAKFNALVSSSGGDFAKALEGLRSLLAGG